MNTNGKILSSAIVLGIVAVIAAVLSVQPAVSGDTGELGWVCYGTSVADCIANTTDEGMMGIDDLTQYNYIGPTADECKDLDEFGWCWIDAKGCDMVESLSDTTCGTTMELNSFWTNGACNCHYNSDWHDWPNRWCHKGQPDSPFIPCGQGNHDAKCVNGEYDVMKCWW